MSDAAIPLKAAGRGHPVSGGPEPGVAHVRAPFPPPGAIPWAPRRAPGGAVALSPDGPYEIVLERSVLVAMRAHVSGTPRESRFGFLAGRLLRCPDTGVHFAVADRAYPSTEEFSEDAPGAFLLRGWAEAQRHFRRHPGVLLGWYHSHPLLGLLLSEGDLDANRRYFAEPWQCSVLLVPDEVRPLGAVFRPGVRAEGGGIAGREPTRFWELPEDPGDESRSPVDWTNYELDAGSGDRVGGRPEPAARAPVARTVEADGSTRPVEPARYAPAAGPAGPGPDPDSGMGLVLANDSDERRFPRFRQRRWPLQGIVAVVVVILIALVLFRGVPGGRGPGPVVVPERTLTPAERSASVLELAIRQYAERRSDFESERIGCDLLAAGYARVDDAFLQLAAEIGRTADPEESLRAAFEDLSASVDDVNRHFDASGCQRPR